MIDPTRLRQLITGSVLTICAISAQAAQVLPISCTTDPNLFNTGYNAASRSVLADESVDPVWDVSPPMLSTNPALPPRGPLPTTFNDAITGNLAPGEWSESPFSNAQWISSRNQGGVVTGDWFYRLRFELDAAVSLSNFELQIDFLADNVADLIWVNGKPLDRVPAEEPYILDGYKFSNRHPVTLNPTTATLHPAGQINEIIVQVKSSPSREGFLAQVNSSAFCPTSSPQLLLTKTASVSNATPGQAIQYAIVLDNGGTASASGTVVSDPLPQGLRDASWTCTASGANGTACGATSGIGALHDTIAHLPAGGLVTYTVSAMMAPGPLDAIVNTASASPPAASNAVCAPSGSAPPCIATATVTVTRRDAIKPAAIPTLSLWGIGLLALVITGAIGAKLRAR